MIEEHERPDMAPQAIRQQSPHDEAFAEIVQARFDDERILLGHAKRFRPVRIIMPSRADEHSVRARTAQKRRPR
jgi:hypothetical protein